MDEFHSLSLLGYLLVYFKDPTHSAYFAISKDGYTFTDEVWQATSNKINEDFKPGGKRVDPENVSTEAPNVFKRIGSDTYVLMYDVYGLRPSNMGFSETTDFITFKNIGRFNEGVMKAANLTSPKHGAVTHLTKKELKAIVK